VTDTQQALLDLWRRKQYDAVWILPLPDGHDMDFPEAEENETLVKLTAPTVGTRSGFCCGIVIKDDKVVKAAPIVDFMRKRKWTGDQVRKYCKSVGWSATVMRKPAEAKAA
jgi:hypothetical protein